MTQIGTLRRWTWWSVIAAGLMVALVTALELSTGKYGPLGTPLLVLAVLVVCVQHVRYLKLAMGGVGRGEQRAVEHLATFAVALAALAYASTRVPVPMAWYLLAAAVIAHVVATTPAASRWPLVAVATAAVVLAGGVFTSGDLLGSLVMPVVLVLGFVGGEAVTLWFWDAVLKLDQARQTSEALAVAEERLRFAADLHDIQGHHLQAIALKGELIARLIGRDDDAARTHADQVADLARTALKETREVVQGYRRASLGTEITNAVGVLRAAGIETAVTGDAADVPPPLQPLFGALVREGTTNVLRHSRARRCAVAVDVGEGQVSVRVHNDGVRPDDPSTPGSGLAGLRERFATVGGLVEACPSGGDGFELVGRVRT